MNHTFIVSSTANVTKGVGIDRRFDETLETLESIHRKVKNPKILFIDNSLNILSSHQKAIIKPYVTILYQFDHNIFSRFVNLQESKGFGEALMIDKSLHLLQINNIVGDRIFKLSGRYKLADSFDIDEYNDPKFQGKYAFRINEWDVSADNWKTRERVVYFETRLFSLCSSLVNEYTTTLQMIFNEMMIRTPNWEKSHYMYLPPEKVIDMKPIHVEGIGADNGVYKFE